MPTRIRYRGETLRLDRLTLAWSCRAKPAIATIVNKRSLRMGDFDTSAPFEIGGLGGVIARDLKGKLGVRILELDDATVDTTVVS